MNSDQIKKMYQPKEKEKAFTLVELAIVLVIVGLLIGGVVAGQELIKQARERKIMQEFEGYNTAVNTFKLKYNSLPGDMRNSTSFLSGSVGNGDGDKIIEDLTNEPFLFWNHLSLSGLVEGRFTGISGSNSSRDADVGINVPESKFGSKAGWYAFFTTSFIGSGDSNWWPLGYGNYLIFGNERANQDLLVGKTITPETAYALDLKYDDGKPGYGMITTMPGQTSLVRDCSDSSNRELAGYKLSALAEECFLIFKPNY